MAICQVLPSFFLSFFHSPNKLAVGSSSHSLPSFQSHPGPNFSDPIQEAVFFFLLILFAKDFRI